MKKILCLIVFIASTAMVYAQEDGPASVVETVILEPKMGHSMQLEEALTAHNEKYHSGDANNAWVRYITYGSRAGDYLWLMSGTYASLDARPDDDGHNKDWAEKVEVHVQSYGPTTVWEVNSSLTTNTGEGGSNKHVRAWLVDLKPGEYYRFNAIMEKMAKTNEEMGRTMFVLDNQVASTGAPDVAMIWPFDSFSEWDEDSNVAATYEKLHGEGSWRLFLEEWRDVVNHIYSQVRSEI